MFGGKLKRSLFSWMFGKVCPEEGAPSKRRITSDGCRNFKYSHETHQTDFGSYFSPLLDF